MWFKLVIESRFAGPGSQTLERSFDQDVTVIGRAAGNDVHLTDSQRVISSRHAEIRRVGNGFYLVDVGSTNGTILNGKRADVRTQYPLKEGDQIRIGEFVIRFSPVAAPLSAPSVAPAPGPVASQPATPRPVARSREPPPKEPTVSGAEHEAVVRKLRRWYADLSHELPERRREALEAILRQATKTLGQAEAVRLLDVVEQRFGCQGATKKPDASSPRPEMVRAVPGSGDAREVAYQGLARIARKYLNDLDEALAPALVEHLVQRLERVFEVVVTHLAGAVRGRREFEREFEVEATRILSWSPNPIKLADDGREIAQYLLDARPKEASLEKVAADLEGVFRDLTLHQLGLVAGFRECLRGLLEQLTPETFEAEARKARVKLGPLALTAPFETRMQLLAWQRFKQKHQKLTEEEVKVFENILAPHFAKGYLAVQKTKSTR